MPRNSEMSPIKQNNILKKKIIETSIEIFKIKFHLQFTLTSY